jgi:hypothetical protein
MSGGGTILENKIAKVTDTVLEHKVQMSYILW